MASQNVPYGQQPNQTAVEPKTFSRSMQTGTHNDQQVTYSPDGSLTGKRISLVNADVTRLEATEYDASGNITKRTLQTREYDSQHNINKSTEFRWNPERKEFEPFVITYNTITYYR